MEVNNTIRHEKKQVTLSNQDIIEIGYMAADIIKGLAKDTVKLTCEQANCYRSVFYLVKDLLKSIDSQYLRNHERIGDFYDQVLSREGDCLELSKHYDITLGHNNTSLSSEPCPICGGEAGRSVNGSNVPIEVMVGQRPICPACARKRAPALAEARDLFYEKGWPFRHDDATPF